MTDSMLEEPERRGVYTCDCCGGAIADGEEYYNFDGEKVCEDCLDDYIAGHRVEAVDENPFIPDRYEEDLCEE